MIEVRMETVEKPTAPGIGRTRVNGDVISSNDRVAVIDHVYIAASVYIDVNIIVAAVNVPCIPADICITTDVGITAGVAGFVVPVIFVDGISVIRWCTLCCP